MNTDFLAINVGNTHVQIGTFVQDKLDSHESVKSRDAAELQRALTVAQQRLAHADAACAVLGSVDSAVSDHVAEVLKKDLKLTVYQVEKDLPIAIGRQLDHETLVGDDRLLNAAAAYDVLKQGCVVVDVGTAATVDYVDGAGTFHGGAIAPGAQLMLDCLHERAAQLPQVKLAKPLDAIGRNSIEAMRSGVYHCLRGLVRELAEHYAEHAGAYPVVIATGGDAELLFGDFDLIERIVPQLTLMGLAVTLRAAREQDE
jgi:type III pantothenate kinase